MKLGRVLGVIAVLAAIAYPALVYIGLTRWSSRWVALVVIAMATLTIAAKLTSGRGAKGIGGIIAVPLCVVTLALLSALSNSELFLLLTPVLISGALLLTFSLTLRPGVTPMVERFARLQDADLTTEKIRWCRTITIVWCGFFVFNGLLAAALAALAPIEWWTLYTSVGAYVLMGCLFAGELILRKLRFEVGAS